MIMEHSLTTKELIAAATKFDTPLYVYDANNIEKQYKKLTTAFAALDTRIFYACKALTNLNILKFIRSTGCNIDCSSINEVQLAIKAGFAPQNILYTSNNIAFEEIEMAQSLGVHINIDSISNLRKFGQKFGHSYPVGIRLRPNIMAGGNLKISTGHGDSKFGVPIEQVQEIVEVVKETNVWISGLHIHTGSEIKDVDVFVQGVKVLFDLVPHFPELTFLDLGGGFKVAYKDGDAATNIPLLGEKLAEAFAAHEKTTGKKLQVWFEPGKYLVSDAGYFITQVNVLKDTPTVTFAGVNSGLNHLIRPMFYDAYHEIKNISNETEEKKNYTVVGNICETDTFAKDRALSIVREGDLLLFFNAGAYCFEMASNYNSRFKPAEVMFVNGDMQLIRKRDVMDDLLKNVVELD
jgi:diaminopimelate decarboxylase